MLDALRGFALFGVLAANLISFSGALIAHVDVSQAASAVQFSLDWLVHGKFYSIFSLLFGIGFALQLRSLDARGEGVSPYVRRLSILFLIGILHLVLIYRGDILALYAMMGFCLLLCRRLDDRALLWFAVLLWVAPVLWALAMTAPEFQPQKPFQDTALGLYAALGRADLSAIPYFISNDPSYLRYVETGLGGVFIRAGAIVQELRPAKVLAMFLIGLWIGRRALHERLDQHRSLLRGALVWGLFIGLPASAVMAWHIQNAPEAGRSLWNLREAAAYTLGVPTLALAYAAGFALLWLQGAARRFLRWFAPAGRMALTNYLVQSIVQGVIFAGWGLGYFGQMSIVWIPVAALVIFAGQVVLSSLWLSAFRFGPFEWLWRSLTYRRPQPMLRRADAAGPGLN